MSAAHQGHSSPGTERTVHNQGNQRLGVARPRELDRAARAIPTQPDSGQERA